MCVCFEEGRGMGDARAEALGEGSGRASFENPRGEGGGTSESFFSSSSLRTYRFARRMVG